MEKADQFIYLWGYKIYEPTTIVTNIAIVILSLLFFVRLKKYNQFRDTKSWRFFFLFLASSSLIGAIAHGIHDQLGKNVFNVIWIIMNSCTLFGAFFATRATVFSLFKSEKVIRTFNTFLIVWIIVIIGVTFYLGNFRITEANVAVLVLFIFISHIYLLNKKDFRKDAFRFIVFGFAVSLLSIIVHVLKISVHEHFNFKDIAHLIMCVSQYLLYRGAMKLGEIQMSHK